MQRENLGSEPSGGAPRRAPAWAFVRRVGARLAALGCLAGASPSHAPSERTSREPAPDVVEVRAGDAGPRVRGEVRWPGAGGHGDGGTLRLWGSPADDSLHVQALFDRVSPVRRWGPACDVRLHIDGREVAMGALDVGQPLPTGVYEAVTVQLGIEEVRALAHARVASGEVCGDALRLDLGALRTLRLFVAQFDRHASPRAPRRDRTPLAGPELWLPDEDEVCTPTPA